MLKKSTFVSMHSMKSPSRFVQLTSVIGLVLGSMIFGHAGLFLGSLLGIYIGCCLDT